jgi:biotin carboxylase
VRRPRLFLVGIAETHLERAIARAQAVGFEVVVGDSARSLARFAAVVAGADRLVPVDYTSYADLARAAEELQRERPLHAVFSFKQDALAATARVQRDLRLHGNPPDAVDACIDKPTARRRLAQVGIAGAQFRECATVAALEDFARALGGPVVVKPPDRQGSLGVGRIDRPGEAAAAFRAALRHSRSGRVLGEELVEGREVSIEGLVSRGRCVVLGVTEKLLYPGTFVESGQITPDVGDELSREEYERVTRRIVEALAVRLGPLHIECFHTPDGRVLVGDLHTRYGGDHIPTLTELSTGSDLHTPIFEELLGTGGEPAAPAPPRRFAGIRYLAPEPGMLSAVSGLERARGIPGVVDLGVIREPGEEIPPLRSSDDRSAWIIATGRDREAVVRALGEAEQALELVVERPREEVAAWS